MPIQGLPSHHIISAPLEAPAGPTGNQTRPTEGSHPTHRREESRVEAMLEDVLMCRAPPDAQKNTPVNSRVIYFGISFHVLVSPTVFCAVSLACLWMFARVGEIAVFIDMGRGGCYFTYLEYPDGIRLPWMGCAVYYLHAAFVQYSTLRSHSFALLRRTSTFEHKKRSHIPEK